jgi:hypothetical protein
MSFETWRDVSLYKTGFTRDVGHARGLTPILPVYSLLVSRSDRDSSCSVHGSREHGASGGLIRTLHLPVHDRKSNPV